MTFARLSLIAWPLAALTLSVAGLVIVITVGSPWWGYVASGIFPVASLWLLAVGAKWTRQHERTDAFLRRLRGEESA